MSEDANEVQDVDIMDVFGRGGEPGTDLATIEIEPVETYVDDEGFIVSAVDGEVLGHIKEKEAFTVNSQDAANWTLELRFNIEARKAFVQSRRDAFNANCDLLLKECDRRLAFWDFKFRHTLVDFARTMLGGRSKTVKFFFGTVAFRAAGKGRREIVMMDEAVEAVRRWRPELVKVVETVNLSDLDACQETAVSVQGEPDNFSGFLKATPGEEGVTIKTGVEGTAVAAKGGKK